VSFPSPHTIAPKNLSTQNNILNQGVQGIWMKTSPFLNRHFPSNLCIATYKIKA
jgi:hypothetical protein